VEQALKDLEVENQMKNTFFIKTLQILDKYGEPLGEPKLVE